MGATEATVPGGLASLKPLDHRRLDRNFFLLMVALIWLGILGSAWLYVSPWWKPVATTLIGR